MRWDGPRSPDFSRKLAAATGYSCRFRGAVRYTPAANTATAATRTAAKPRLTTEGSRFVVVAGAALGPASDTSGARRARPRAGASTTAASGRLRWAMRPAA